MPSDKKSSTSFHSTSSVDLSAFFGACSGLGEVFTVARNDYLLIGSIADPIRYIRQGRMRLLDAGALQINHSRRFTLDPAPAVQSCACRVVEGMDFVNRHGEGFLKICKTDRTNAEGWSRFVQAQLDARTTAVPHVRRATNELDLMVDETPGLHPGREMCSQFLGKLIEEGQVLEITMRGDPVRGYLSFMPTAFEFRRDWCCVFNEMSGCHFKLSRTRVTTEREKQVLRITDGEGRLIGRFFRRSVMSRR